MAYLICLTGPDDEDKKRLLSGLAAELAGQGFRVGLIARNQDIPGPAAEAELSLGSQGLALKRRLSPEPSIDQLLGRYFADMDLVLSAAHDEVPAAKVAWSPQGPPADEPATGVRALVCPQAVEASLPVFALGDVAGLARFLADEAIPSRKAQRTRIVLDGRKLPIKGFVQDIVANAVRGLVQSLRGGDKPGRLEIFIED